MSGTAPLGDRLARVASRWTLGLTHYGRKTGRPYQVTIWFMVDGEIVYLPTANLGRQWPRNVRKRPQVILALDGERFGGTAELLTDPDDLEHAAALAQRKYPITIPVDWLMRLVAWVSGRPREDLFPGGFFRVRLGDSR